MAFELIVLSIFRQSENYVINYLTQLYSLFNIVDKPCSAVWLEGDSTDNTYSILESAIESFEKNGHSINLIKYDCNGPYWKSVDNIDRWLQLSTCWNKCLDNIKPAKYTICVESDIEYDPQIVPNLIRSLDNDHHVIFPMLMIKNTDYFYDTWGFSIDNVKFQNHHPFYKTNQRGHLLKLTSGGGMIVSTYDVQKQGRFGSNNCLMKYPDNINLYMDTRYKIYHPRPK